jgi:voltage-gated potassium channel
LTNLLDKIKAEYFFSGLIIFSVICFSVETMPGLSTKTVTFLKVSEIVVTIIFTMEYLYRVYKSHSKLSFIFSFWGLVDLVAILPFYLSTSIDLRSLRILRLLRMLKLFRYNRALQRFNKALAMVKDELIVFSFGSLVVIYLAAFGIYQFENYAQPNVFKSIFDCLW